MIVQQWTQLFFMCAWQAEPCSCKRIFSYGCPEMNIDYMKDLHFQQLEEEDRAQLDSILLECQPHVGEGDN